MLFSSLLFVPPFHRDRENYKEDIEAVGKHFLMRWNADNDDPYKYHKLKNAFRKAECEGSFESGDPSYDKLRTLLGNRVSFYLTK